MSPLIPLHSLIDLPSGDVPTKTRCIQIQIPDGDDYLAELAGVMRRLTIWSYFMRDSSHKGSAVANAWRACLLRGFVDCATGETIYIEESDYEMAICEQLRWHDGKLQGLCCGEWTDIPSDGTAPIPGEGGQPNTGSNPGPGQTACNSVSLFAGNQWLLPIPVNTGDILTVTDLQGGWTGGGAGWTYGDGVPYVFGHPLGSPYHWLGDPDATLFHGQLAYLINGSYYSASGGAFTVPGGVSNAQCILVGNFQDTAAGGTVTFNVCFENGTPPPTSDWCYTFDFSLSDYSALFEIVPTEPGTYTPGTGYESTSTGGSNESFLLRMIAIPAVTGTYVSVETIWTATAASGHAFVYQYPGTVDNPANVMGDNDYTYSEVPVAGRNFDVEPAGAAHFVCIKQIWRGTGTCPFGPSNC